MLCFLMSKSALLAILVKVVRGGIANVYIPFQETVRNLLQASPKIILQVEDNLFFTSSDHCILKLLLITA